MSDDDVTSDKANGATGDLLAPLTEAQRQRLIELMRRVTPGDWWDMWNDADGGKDKTRAEEMVVAMRPNVKMSIFGGVDMKQKGVTVVLSKVVAKGTAEQARAHADVEFMVRARECLPRLLAERDRYRVALADATRRPMGVVPESAEGLVTAEAMEAAEARRPRHGTLAAAAVEPGYPVPESQAKRQLAEVAAENRRLSDRVAELEAAGRACLAAEVDGSSSPFDQTIAAARAAERLRALLPPPPVEAAP